MAAALSHPARFAGVTLSYFTAKTPGKPGFLGLGFPR